MEYAWDYPAARDKKILLSIGAARRVIDIMEIGDLMPFKFNVRHAALTHRVRYLVTILRTNKGLVQFLWMCELMVKSRS